jgi:ASC-1-like (ASCH) protein
MIISKKYAIQLVKQGKAKIEGKLKPDDRGTVYTIITRYDLQRTDHYKN